MPKFQEKYLPVTCNSDISEMADRCPKCGAIITKSQNDNNIIRDIKIPWNKVIKVLIPIACVVIVTGIVIAILNSRLDETELYVCDCLNDLVDREGNITVTDDIVYIVYDDKAYVTIPFGSDRAYYVDKKYLGNESEYQRIQYKNQSDYSKSEYDYILQRKIDFAQANIAYTTAKLMFTVGGDSEQCRYVSAARVCKKMNISYR